MPLYPSPNDAHRSCASCMPARLPGWDRPSARRPACRSHWASGELRARQARHSARARASGRGGPAGARRRSPRGPARPGPGAGRRSARSGAAPARPRGAAAHGEPGCGGAHPRCACVENCSLSERCLGEAGFQTRGSVTLAERSDLCRRCEGHAVCGCALSHADEPRLQGCPICPCTACHDAQRPGAPRLDKVRVQLQRAHAQVQLVGQRQPLVVRAQRRPAGLRAPAARASPRSGPCTRPACYGMPTCGSAWQFLARRGGSSAPMSRSKQGAPPT